MSRDDRRTHEELEAGLPDGDEVEVLDAVDEGIEGVLVRVIPYRIRGA
jgi:hypothetical protein